MEYHVYCDETCISDRFTAWGAIVIPADNVPKIEARIRQFREEEKLLSEIKWEKINPQRFARYKRLVDYFFALYDAKQLCFHAMMVDTHEVDHRTYNAGDKETGFYKFYYQLILHCCGRKYFLANPESRFHLFLDYRTSKYPLVNLQGALNNGFRKACDTSIMAYLSIAARDSHSSGLMQMNDVLLGAVGFQKNGRDLVPGTRQAKIDMARYIATKAKLPHLRDGTPWGRERFTLWDFRLRKRGTPKT